MRKINIEIKAKYENLESARKILYEKGAVFKGTDHQIDTYFNVPPNKRIKLREGNIENYLIYYQRKNYKEPKRSDVTLYKPEKIDSLKFILTEGFGVKVVVKKQREIYWLGNIKIHLDKVNGLGTFVEIESTSNKKEDVSRLRSQTEQLMKELKINKSNLIEKSYADLILAKNDN